MNINLEAYDYPVKEVLPELHGKLKEGNRVILSAPPGAGKSTLLPVTLLDQPWLQGKKVLMLEPRRLAAKSIASRMSQMIGEPTGTRIGYRVRFESNISEETVIEVITEGILTRMLQSDNSLEEVGLIIFDEFHERSIHADLSLALSLESQAILRPDLKLLVMSATIDTTELATLLKAPVVESMGKIFPVETFYAGDTDVSLLPEMISRTIQRAVKENEGDVLVFLPGEREIKETYEILNRKLIGFRIHQLFGRLPFSKQQAAIKPDRSGGRKVVLATSIAETSLTIEGVRIVVDCGFGKKSIFDPHSGLSKLTTVQIAKDSADQRRGRAGRLGPGVCYRMWTKGTHQYLSDYTKPEILETDLCPLVLDLANWGINDIKDVQWLTEPSKGNVSQAKDILIDLNAIDESGKITKHGKAIHRLPCHPRIAHMLIESATHGLEGLATDLAAILEERDPLDRNAGTDINERVVALRRYRRDRGQNIRFKRIDTIAVSYIKLLNATIETSTVDPYETGLLLTYAYPERIACAKPGNNAQFQLANGRIAAISHKDDLAHEPWIVACNLDAREGMGKIFMASPLNPEDLAPLVKEQTIIQWDVEDERLRSTIDLRIGNIVLKSKPITELDDELAIKAILTAVKKYKKAVLNLDDGPQGIIARVVNLKRWNPTMDWPDFKPDSLFESCDDWLAPYLSGITTKRNLDKLNLETILKSALPYDLQSELESRAPVTMEVPSGSKIKIEYKVKNEAPVLSVRLQELFGLLNTPLINRDSIPLRIHLLSPGYKPVQVTEDLNSFWTNTYIEVKKEMKGRYPKHYWPEDPFKAEAVRGVKRKKK